MTLKEIGETIRTMRESRRMTQEQLANAIGKSTSAITMYESGNRRPKDDVIEALADVFNVPKWSLLYSEEEIAPMLADNAPDNESKREGGNEEYAMNNRANHQAQPTNNYMGLSHDAIQLAQKFMFLNPSAQAVIRTIIEYELRQDTYFNTELEEQARKYELIISGLNNNRNNND